MSIETFDICGTAALDQVEAYLRTQGYVPGPCHNPGEFTAHPSDGAPGWADWMYEMSISLLPGHSLALLMQGFRDEGDGARR